MIKDANLTIYNAYLNSAKENADLTALIFRNKKFTYEHVLKKINQLAYSLKKLGYKENDVITVMLPNIPDAVYLLYAVNQIGAIINLVHPMMKYDELREIMIKTKSKILFVLDSRVNEFKDLNKLGINLYATSPVDEMNIFVRIAYKNQYKVEHFEFETNKLFTKNELHEFNKDYKKDAFYLHSGGTTGEPKTVALSSFALNSVAKYGLKFLHRDSMKGLGMMSVLPMFHSFGLVMGIHICLMFGAYDVLIPKFHTETVIKYIKNNQIHLLIGVPILYEALLRNKVFSRARITKLDNAFIGGDFVSEMLRRRFNNRTYEASARAHLFEGYGLTETLICCVNTFERYKDGSVGKPIDNVDIKAFDENSNMLPPDKEGELYVSGDTLMNGYRFEKESLNPYHVDKNGVKWIKTGDYGKVDKDGFVYYIQRLKRIVKVSGVSVFPSMIENELMALPYIFECYIKGVKDEKHGSILKLYVVLDRKSKGMNFDDEIKKLILNKFGVYALPKEIIYLEKFPKTLVGKVDGKKLPN